MIYVYMNAERIKPDVHNGLNDKQVELRKSQKLINKTKIVVGKSYWQIIREDVFSFFNILLFIIAGFIIYRNAASNGVYKWWKDLFFIGVLVLNIAISLYQDIKARHLMSKLRVVTAPKATVIRNGQKLVIPTEELVLDDIVYLSGENQISSDSILLEGTLLVNESLLTGESKSIVKNAGDTLYSGSYVVSGKGYALVDKVGKDSYVETIQAQANKFARSPSKILTSLRRIFRVIGAVVIATAIVVIILAVVKHQFDTPTGIFDLIDEMSGSLVGMIPAGLYLLTSVALAVGVITLAKKRAQVQDFYSIEMLSRADVLCVDKTGTITDGTMQVNDIINLSKLDDKSLNSLIANIVNNVQDTNATAKALMTYFNEKPSKTPLKILPFNSDNKYSGISFETNETYILGAGQFLNLKNKDEIISKITEYAKQGLRVLVLGKGDQTIVNDSYNGELIPLALIILQDHIRDDAKQTFDWFNQNGVEIKVISGDDPLTVSQIAKQAGVLNADKYISLEGMSIDEVYNIANEYTVFARVTPEQKEAIIKSLKDHKKTVAMTGDGVNDILALKRADCSIAMASGAEAARNVSHIVLLDSNFATLPDVVGEGRRVVNNLQRTSSLFLVKTVFVTFFTISFIIFKLFPNGCGYPFVPSQMSLWELFTIGLASFFLALEPNKEIIKGGFVRNILKNALSSALLVIIGVVAVFVLYAFNANRIVYTGIDSWTVAITMASITFTLLSVVVLLDVCLPLNKYRGFVFGFSALGVIACLLAVGLTSYYEGLTTNFFAMQFEQLKAVNLLTIGIIVLGCSVLFFSIKYIVKILCGGKTNDKSK